MDDILAYLSHSSFALLAVASEISNKGVLTAYPPPSFSRKNLFFSPLFSNTIKVGHQAKENEGVEARKRVIPTSIAMATSYTGADFEGVT